MITLRVHARFGSNLVREFSHRDPACAKGLHVPRIHNPRDPPSESKGPRADVAPIEPGSVNEARGDGCGWHCVSGDRRDDCIATEECLDHMTATHMT